MAVNRPIINHIGSVLVFVLFNITASGQTNFLSEKISIQLSAVPLNEALDKIARKGGFRFAYDAALLKNDQKVTLQVKDTKINEILDLVFEKAVRYKQIGNHVILTAGAVSLSPSREKKSLTLSGTVRDAETKKPLGNVTIYDQVDRITVATDEFGKYNMILKQGNGSRGISFCKIQYHDTVIFINPSGNIAIDVAMKPLPEVILKAEPISAQLFLTEDTINGENTRIGFIEDMGFVKILVPETMRESARNLVIYGNRPVQLSVVPYLSTNGKNCGSLSNALSINLFAGYARELNGFEVGGLVNIERFHVSGVQLAGAGNIIGGTLRGLQTGGIFNITMGPVHGGQLSGGMNWLHDSLKGLQFSGIGNVVNGKMKGLQFSGLFNASVRHVDGCQVSGLINIGKKDNNGAQVCGIANFTKENWGFQLSGIGNIAKKENRGAQVAGLFNYTKRLNGFQLALFNYVNILENGVPVGFLSIVRHGGYYRFEVSSDEIFYLNIAYRGGTSRFYNIFKTGIGESRLVNFTWGFGTRFPVGKFFSMSFDLTNGLVMTTSSNLKYHGLLTKLNPTFDFRLAKHLILYTGPSANLYWYYTGNSDKPDGIAPYTIYDEIFTTGPHGIQIWVGGVIGIKI